MECIYKAFFQIQSILPIYYSHSHLPLNVIQFPDKNITPIGAHKTLWVIKMYDKIFILISKNFDFNFYFYFHFNSKI